MPPLIAKTFQCRGFGECRMVSSRSEHLARYIRRPSAALRHIVLQFSRLDNLRQHAQTVHAAKADLNESTTRGFTDLQATMWGGEEEGEAGGGGRGMGGGRASDHTERSERGCPRCSSVFLFLLSCLLIPSFLRFSSPLTHFPSFPESSIVTRSSRSAHDTHSPLHIPSLPVSSLFHFHPFIGRSPFHSLDFPPTHHARNPALSLSPASSTVARPIHTPSLRLCWWWEALCIGARRGRAAGRLRDLSAARSRQYIRGRQSPGVLPTLFLSSVPFYTARQSLSSASWP
ncbi:hypothetical protein C8R44DRAFT_826766 [Mycena epipterygia]|nr:hypothetical protein C8R44DRAFT_826766 [Mycena epipterygia]